jgi:hypothetical protein
MVEYSNIGLLPGMLIILEGYETLGSLKILNRLTATL